MNGPPTDKRPADEVAATLPPPTRPDTAPAPALDRLTSETLDVVSYRDPLPAAEFPGYEILGELGRGGMGLVYKARQIDLNRVVALKVILSGAHAGGEERVRFFTEARTIARLRHPHIVQVYEVGENRGHPFFSLEFCGGGSLDRRLAGTPLPPREAAALVEKLARAMQLAHDYHIVHRDLKPANVLLVEDGSPRITDFGLAKLLDQDGLSRSGALVGTPSYMAPEQAAGKTHEIGPPADIWALGAILYECLTGRPPFKAASVMETIQQVQTDAPVPPSQFQKKLGRDLETICLKCLQKEPHKRYASAIELAEDLRRFQAGETIRARPVGRIEKAASWARRRPAAAALVVVSVVAVLALLGGAAFFTDQLRTQRNDALDLKERAERGEADARSEKERAIRGETDAQNQKNRADAQLVIANEEKRKATEQLDHARRNLFTARLIDAIGQLEREPDEALAKLHDYAACPLELRDFSWGLHARLARRDRVTLAEPDGVSAVAFRPDGKTLATVARNLPVRLWDAATGRQLRALDTPTRHIEILVWSPDGSRLAAGFYDATIRLWDIAGAGPPVDLKGHTASVKDVAFSPDGKTLASAGADGKIKLWDVGAAKELTTVETQAGSSDVALAFSPNGKELATLTGRTTFTIKVWDLESKQVRNSLPLASGPPQRLFYTPDGKTVIAAGGKLVTIWEAATTKPATIELPEWLGGAALSPDGKTLAVGDKSHTLPARPVLRLYELATLRPIQLLRGHKGDINALAFHPNGKTLAAGSNDLTTRLWTVSLERHSATFAPHTGAVVDAAFLPDGKTLVALEEGALRLWDVAGTRPPTVLTHRTGELTALAVHPDGKTIYTSSKDNTVRAWNLARGRVQTNLTEHPAPVMVLALDAAGTTLAAGTADGTVVLWDTTTDKVRRTIKAHGGGPVLAVCFHPNGTSLLTSGEDKLLKSWDLVQGGEGVVWKGNPTWVSAIAFSRDGKTLATGDWNATVQLWHPATATVRTTLSGHKTRVTSVAVSPDGATLVSGSFDGKIGLWEVVTGQSRGELTGHDKAVTRVVFQPGSDRLASAGGDGVVRLWDADAGALRATLAIPRGSDEGWDTFRRVGGGVCFHPDGRTLAAAGGVRNVKASRYERGAVALFDTGTGQLLKVLPDFGGSVVSVTSSPDGKTLAATGTDGAVTLCDLATSARVVLRGHTATVWCAAYSPDGRTLVTGGNKGEVNLWEVATGRQRGTLSGHEQGVGAVAFSPDGKLLATASDEGALKWWDAQEERVVAALTGHAVACLAFSPDGKTLVSGGESGQAGELQVWDVATRKARRTLTGHAGKVNAVAYSPDGRLLAAGDGTGSVKLWETATFAEVATFSGHAASVTTLAFSGDGRTLASGDVDARVNVWTVPR